MYGVSPCVTGAILYRRPPHLNFSNFAVAVLCWRGWSFFSQALPCHQGEGLVLYQCQRHNSEKTFQTFQRITSGFLVAAFVEKGYLVDIRKGAYFCVLVLICPSFVPCVLRIKQDSSFSLFLVRLIWSSPLYWLSCFLIEIRSSPGFLWDVPWTSSVISAGFPFFVIMLFAHGPVVEKVQRPSHSVGQWQISLNLGEFQFYCFRSRWPYLAAPIISDFFFCYTSR